MDPSNGYNKIAADYIKHRGQSSNGIGVSTIQKWLQTIPAQSSILDIGCGSGLPVSKLFIDAGMNVFGIDASPVMIEAFRKNCTAATCACESVEESDFFGRSLDAIVACGLIFLLSETAQKELIIKISHALNKNGKFLFTAPKQRVEWKDILT